MPRLLQNRHLLLELVDLKPRGVGHVEALDGDLTVPVTFVNLADAATSHTLGQTDAVERNAPLVHDTVSVLLGGKRGSGWRGGGAGGVGGGKQTKSISTSRE